MKPMEYHVMYEVISTEPGFKWKVGKDHYHTQSEAWERCKSLARKDRAIAFLHGVDGTVREVYNYEFGNRGKIDISRGKAWYED